MTSAIRDLWPAEFGDNGLTPPVTILRQQATILGQKTKNLVEGDVYTSSLITGDFWHKFYLVAPAMDGYRYTLFEVRHKINFYPLDLKVFNSKTTFHCDDEAEFLEALQILFASEETRKVISALIAQSKA